jgi:DNA replicative helicase MCM subunit Mcm2 (Cdc46/Mcm family)
VKKLREKGKPWSDFELAEIGVPYHVFRRLVYDYDLFEVTYHSNKHTFYKFKAPIEEVEARLNEYDTATSVATIPEEEKVAKIPDDFWATVEGYEDIKEVFLASLRADSPVHILLVGDPATGKSVMLMEVERLAGSVFVTAGTATHVGLRDILIDRKPRYLIIDELDKIRDPKDLSVLLTLMETGRVIVAKHKELREEHLKTWVFAACNSTRNLPPELLDRFLVFHLRPYDKETLKQVIVKALMMREGVAKDLAEHIADKVAGSYGSVRDAVKLARLAKTREDVDKLWGIVLKYRRAV